MHAESPQSHRCVMSECDPKQIVQSCDQCTFRGRPITAWLAGILWKPVCKAARNRRNPRARTDAGLGSRCAAKVQAFLKTLLREYWSPHANVTWRVWYSPGLRTERSRGECSSLYVLAKSNATCNLRGCSGAATKRSATCLTPGSLLTIWQSLRADRARPNSTRSTSTCSPASPARACNSDMMTNVA